MSGGTRTRAALLTAMVLGQLGLFGCKKAPEPVGNGPAAANPVVSVPLPEPPTAVAVADEVSPAAESTPAAVPTFPGPQSESRDHFSVTMGFQGPDGQPTSRPKAIDTTRFFISALDPESRPIGQLAQFADAELHAFLVARDLRHALYANGSGPAKPGSDSRQVRFSPREGGDHALVSVFQPTGGRLRLVSSPVAIVGALPQVAGPGVAGLSSRMVAGKRTLQLEALPGVPQAGRAVRLTVRTLAARGQTGAVFRAPFFVVLNEELGWGDVVTCDAQGGASWLPPTAGTYLVMAPPTTGEQALMWKLDIAAAAPPAR